MDPEVGFHRSWNWTLLLRIPTLSYWINWGELTHQGEPPNDLAIDLDFLAAELLLDEGGVVVLRLPWG